MGVTIPGNVLDMVGFDPSFGHTPWNLEMEKNLRVLDASMFGCRVQGFGLPFTPVAGELWIDPTGNLCLWSGLAWEVYPPAEGFEVYVVQYHSRYRYNGVAWILATYTGSGAVTYTQSSPSLVWGPAFHSFGRYASISLRDSSGQTIFGDTREVSIGVATATFARPCSGTMLLT